MEFLPKVNQLMIMLHLYTLRIRMQDDAPRSIKHPVAKRRNFNVITVIIPTGEVEPSWMFSSIATK